MKRHPVTGLAVLLLLQSAATLFFVHDSMADFFGGAPDGTGWLDSDRTEAMVTLVLGASVIATVWHLLRAIRREKALRTQLKIASGALSKVIEDHFDSWALTPSEREVAMLAIKGFSISEMATLRQTRDGTIKAQCGAVYKKAGVSGRLQLLSLFIEELLDETLIKNGG